MGINAETLATYRCAISVPCKRNAQNPEGLSNNRLGVSDALEGNKQ